MNPAKALARREAEFDPTCHLCVCVCVCVCVSACVGVCVYMCVYVRVCVLIQVEDGVMERLIEQLLQDVRDGRVLYVHCWGGHGRAGLMLSCVCACLCV
jgi:hypothetical protein